MLLSAIYSLYICETCQLFCEQSKDNLEGMRPRCTSDKLAKSVTEMSRLSELRAVKIFVVDD